MTNKEFSLNEDLFKKCCEEAGIKATSRQASKFRNGKGLAFKKKPYFKGLTQK